ncbi:MAG: glycerol-3-phosphate dehydrogenase/oxidase [Rubrivivax sp.]
MSDTAFERSRLLAQLREPREWDLVVVGGGASGLGVALDAAVRGFSVVLLESDDFAKGTSSRSTKLVHGGVRYLAQGDIGLVREALHERTTLLANVPHVAQRLAFVVPGYKLWEAPFYGAGLKMYDTLAGRQSLGRTELLSARETRQLLPTVRSQGLVGGVKYWDGQFDDARLASLLARTAISRGATVLNHCAVTDLLRQDGRVCGVRCADVESDAGEGKGETFVLRARCVVNATGVWVDALRGMDRDSGSPAPKPLVAPSQGVHLVVDRSFMPGTHALMVPKTGDGRVLFVVPWLGKTILGTTDTPRDDLAREPAPFKAEVDFILGEAGRYLDRQPTRADVRSVWVGLRPLVRAGGDDGDNGDNGNTKSLSREHTVVVARSGLVTVTGGKWTTYRAMAEDVLEHCMSRGLLDSRPAGVTERMPLMGAAPGRPLCEAPGEHLYGSEAALLRSLPGADNWLWRDSDSPHGNLSEAMVRFALRFEMARTLEDVLARRSRLLFLDAARAAELAEPVAALIEQELGRPVTAQQREDFAALAQRYLTVP